MSYFPDRPCIVQGDYTVLLEVDHALHAEARDLLAGFAELEKSPEYVHTYRITPLSLWNAAASGATAEGILAGLEHFSKHELPANVVVEIREQLSRYGRLKLKRTASGAFVLESADPALLVELSRNAHIRDFLTGPIEGDTLPVRGELRGHLKQALIQIGYPVEDLAGFLDGASLEVALRERSARGLPFALRPYQAAAVDAFWAGGGPGGGSGVVVLACGAGKTMVGLGVIAQAATHTLVLCHGTVAARQWIDEIVDKTEIPPELVGEYTGNQKEIRPITVATYQVLTYRPRRSGSGGAMLNVGDFPHLALFTRGEWGLVIYDEVHLLPAPVFRITAEIQARRRLGLTATLVREDGREADVFSLIGPKRYEVPWKTLEQQGWIATARCHEIRVNLPAEERMAYALAEETNERHHLAAVNPAKLKIVRTLLRQHPDGHALVIGQYLEQLEEIAASLGAPIITGKTAVRERQRLYEAFRAGEVAVLVVSKVANFAIDLPSANVAIQVSGTFGSRQEEAQRLGRVLRPKADGSEAHFYSIVSRDTTEQSFAARRQLFLTEQGYRYLIIDASEIEL
jgi:DNA excision repair protein ERCC-3